MSPNDTPCIADFGLSVILTESAEARHSLTSSAGTAAGTVRWQAPELFRGERNSLASDMFAFACLCYEVGRRHSIIKPLDSDWIRYSQDACHMHISLAMWLLC